jgi:metal-dependent amidase/aminoacylase/carboxypeptidase family protein
MRAAGDIAGDANVHVMPPLMAGEDFAFMLEQRPGALIFYDFNDEATVFGTSYWIKLVRTRCPREAVHRHFKRRPI